MQYDIKPGMRSGTYKPGDILNFVGGNYDYFTSDGMIGTVDDPILFQFNSGCVFSNGFDMQNVDWLIFDGGVNKNILVKNATGVPLSFKGKCSNIEVKGIEIDGAYSWLWFKTEVNEWAYANWNYWTKNDDGTISANYIMDGFKLSNFTFKDANFDGCYIDSTGQQKDRPVTIDGVTYYPLPPQCANIQIQNGTMDGSSRTGAQISGVIAGTNYLKNVKISNCGKSLEQYQGACFLLGGNSSAGIEVDSCVFDGSNLYATRFDGGGDIKFTNNTVLNSTVVNGVKNKLPMAAVQFDSYDSMPAKFTIYGNNIDASNNGVSIVVYGDTKSVNPDSEIHDNVLAGSFQNLSGVPFKTGGVIIPPPPPVITGRIDSDFISDSINIFFSDGTFKTYKNIKRYAVVNKSKQINIFFNDGTSLIVK